MNIRYTIFTTNAAGEEMTITQTMPYNPQFLNLDDAGKLKNWQATWRIMKKELPKGTRWICLAYPVEATKTIHNPEWP